MVNVASVCVCVRERWWVIITSVVYVLGGNVASVHVHVYALGERGVIVASVHFHVYVLGKWGSMLPLFISICMCYGRVNVARVHVHALGRSMLPLVMSMCMCLGDGNVAAVDVASVHVNVHVLRADQCCLYS